MDRDRNTDLLGLDEIRREVDRLATILPPFDKRLLPFYGAQHRDTCGAHVEVDNGEYHRYVLERGKEISRKSSPSLDDLLFWIFQSLTSNLSWDYELENRIQGQDHRRIGFAKQVDLLRQINIRWAEREEAEHQRILRDYPFKDRL